MNLVDYRKYERTLGLVDHKSANRLHWATFLYLLFVWQLQLSRYSLLPALAKLRNFFRPKTRPFFSFEWAVEMSCSFSGGVINIRCILGFRPSGIIRGLCWYKWRPLFLERVFRRLFLLDWL